MDADALKYMHHIGREAAPAIIRTDAEPPHVYYRRNAGGELERVVAAPAPASVAVYDLGTLVQVAKDAGRADIYYSPDAVVVVFGEDRRSRAALKLNRARPFALLEEWERSAPALPQPDLIRHLRVTLAGCTGPSGNIVEILRRVKFRTGQEIVSEVGHGKASLGKAIEGEVTGTSIIPPELALAVPVWSNPCLSHLGGTIRCALDPDPGTGTFRVTPLPGMIEITIDSACTGVGNDIRDRLQAEGVEGVGVYYGKP